MRVLEEFDRRVVAAVRFVDAITGLPVDAPLRVRSLDARWLRNRRGLYVLAEVEGLEAYGHSFRDPPSEPALGSRPVSFEVVDPSGRYLARGGRLAVPRDPDPAHRDRVGSLFRPVDVALFAATHVAVAANWAVLRVSLRARGTDRAVPGALLRVEAVTGGAILARALADARGEALVAVPGVPVSAPSAAPNGNVLEHEIEADLVAIADPAIDPDRPPIPVPDPDDLESGRAGLRTATTRVRLASGRARALTLPISLEP